MSRKKILIVDDSAVVLRALSMKLNASGYQTFTAVDGSQAITIVRQQEPDLILLDLSFPPDVGHGGGVPWDGFLIMEWLRRMEQAKNTPFVIITGNDSEQVKQRALTAGAASFFHKPIDSDELLVKIREALRETPETAETV